MVRMQAQGGVRSSKDVHVRRAICALAQPAHELDAARRCSFAAASGSDHPLMFPLNVPSAPLSVRLQNATTSWAWPSHTCNGLVWWTLPLEAPKFPTSAPARWCTKRPLAALQGSGQAWHPGRKHACLLLRTFASQRCTGLRRRASAFSAHCAAPPPVQGTFLDRGQDEVVAAIEERIARWTLLPVGNGEGLQVLVSGWRMGRHQGGSAAVSPWPRLAGSSCR